MLTTPAEVGNVCGAAAARAKCDKAKQKQTRTGSNFISDLRSSQNRVVQREFTACRGTFLRSHASVALPMADGRNKKQPPPATADSVVSSKTISNGRVGRGLALARTVRQIIARRDWKGRMLAAQKHAAIPHQLLERLADARRRSDALFALVRGGSLYERPIPERHRIIFYVGHLEAFDWNLLRENVSGPGSGLKRVHPELDRLFAFGIDPVGGGLPADLPSDWPSLETVGDYVRHIRGAVDDNLEKVIGEPESQARDIVSLRCLLDVAVEHRLMHAETLAYMLHRLPLDM